jgi:hypothetical protein
METLHAEVPIQILEGIQFLEQPLIRHDIVTILMPLFPELFTKRIMGKDFL